MNFETLLNQWKSLGTLRLSLLGGSLTILMVVIFFLMTRISQPEMALLYGDLELREGSLITEKLQNSGISFEMKDGGKQIYVPASEVLKSRMMIAEAGLPAGGSVGYEIFDRSDVLGSTNFVQNVNLLRAIEGELARTIRTLHGVSAVRV
ncbi:MAG: flagellar basal-body MS-ring/collar protein FliF, partial [Holosporales bacterium]